MRNIADILAHSLSLTPLLLIYLLCRLSMEEIRHEITLQKRDGRFGFGFDALPGNRVSFILFSIHKMTCSGRHVVRYLSNINACTVVSVANFSSMKLGTPLLLVKYLLCVFHLRYPIYQTCCCCSTKYRVWQSGEFLN